MMANMKKAIVLLSGGLDSTTCLAIAKDQGHDCYALSFDYGQKCHHELQQARIIAKQMGVTQHEIVRISIGHLGGSALTDQAINIPIEEETQAIPNTYVPARNTTFLSIALGWAEIIHASTIMIGVSAVDYSGYPDCRPEYINAFQTMANLATKAGIEGDPVQIVTPLITLTKAQTIATGLALGVDYSQTVSCYQAMNKGVACGHCDSCQLRLAGFAQANHEDPIRYQ